MPVSPPPPNRFGLLAVAVALLLLSAPAAGAKNFRPGELRICGARAVCLPLRAQPLLDSMSAFFYGPGAPSMAARPPAGEPTFQLAFRDGYVTGIVAGGRFLSYGVNLGRFEKAVWYRVPARTARALRALGSSLHPLRLTSCLVRLSNSGPTLATLPGCARR